MMNEWSENVFVIAGGADPGGNLAQSTPLALDIYHEPMVCDFPATVSVTFLLRCDYPPYGAGYPAAPPGQERIPWCDTTHYPFGYPNDDNSFNEEEWAMWDITSFMDQLCLDQSFSMRVRVTDHAGNWARSGFLENQEFGVPGIDSGVLVSSIHAYSTPDLEWRYSGPAPEDVPLGAASIIHLRDDYGKAHINYAVIAHLFGDDPPQVIYGTAKSTEYFDPGPGCFTNNVLYFSLLPLEAPLNAQLDNILGPKPPCDRYYIASLTIQDTPNGGLDNNIFVSSRDDYVTVDDGADHTFIAANKDDSPGFGHHDFEAYSENLTYGKRRGSGREAPSENDEELAWYNYERMIKTGGFEKVIVKVENKQISLPVQSQCDLVYINSHGAIRRSVEPKESLAFVLNFTDQGQSELFNEFIRFSAHQYNFQPPSVPVPDDFIPEIFCKYPFFKLQEYLPPYNDPSWIVFDACHQLSYAGGGNSARAYWHQRILEGYFDAIAGYNGRVNTYGINYITNHYSFFLKYCATDFSSILLEGPVAYYEYYYSDLYYLPIIECQNKEYWLAHAWLVSHIKEQRDLTTAWGFSQPLKIAASMSSNYLWYIKKVEVPDHLHRPLLAPKNYFIFMTSWDGP